MNATEAAALVDRLIGAVRFHDTAMTRFDTGSRAREYAALDRLNQLRAEIVQRLAPEAVESEGGTPD